MKARSALIAVIFFIGLFVPTVCHGGDEVVCFGDSATAGAVDLSFPDYLEFFIDPGNEQVANEGESGETSAEGYWRALWLILSLQYYDAKVWTYWMGGNDLIDWVQDIDPYMRYDPESPNYPYRDELNDKLDDIEANIRLTVRAIELTGAGVVLGTYLQLVPVLSCSASPVGFLTPGLADKANHYLSELNDVIRNVSADMHLGLNDMEANLGGINGRMIYYHDCNHLNGLGNFVVALSWWIAVSPYLN